MPKDLKARILATREKMRQHNIKASLAQQEKLRKRAEEAQQRAQLYSQQAESERITKQRVAEEISKLREAREAKQARLLTEKELRKEKLRPYTEAAQKLLGTITGVGKGIQKTVNKFTPPEPKHVPKPKTQDDDNFLDIGNIKL